MISAVHPFDSPIFGEMFVSAEARELFNNHRIIQNWLDVEAALARAQGEIGLIPAAAAQAIAEHANLDSIDINRLEQQTAATSHPLVALLQELARSAGSAGDFVHWGATTQDIIDTGMALSLKRTYSRLESDLVALAGQLADLAERHRQTPMAARTHGQHAAPTTFGFKVAVWLAECLRHRERLQQSRSRVLVGQLSGAVGTMAAMSGRGREVQRRVCELLNLECPEIAWHSSRDGIAEFVALSGLIGATMGKIAQEVVELQRTEIGELEEHFELGKIGSSTMPHKRNPIYAETILAGARSIAAKCTIGISAAIHAHERDGAAWITEWSCVPECACLLLTLVSRTETLIAGLTVHRDRMLANLETIGSPICSEAAMFALASHTGKRRAHEIIYTAAMRAFEQGLPFIDCILDDPEAATKLDRETLVNITSIEKNLGEAESFTDEIVRQARRSLMQQQEGFAIVRGSLDQEGK